MTIAILAASSAIVVGRADAPPLPGATASEYEVKAAFIFNFARFIEWPPGAFKDAADPFVIAVLGPDPFGRSLDETLAGKSVSGHPVSIRRVSQPEETRGAHIVFVGTSDRARVSALLSQVGQEGVLTVGEGERFAAQGGIIGFLLRGRRVRFEINQRKAGEANLKVSSQLLKLATLVSSEK
jgi:hypothetical protein